MTKRDLKRCATIVMACLLMLGAPSAAFATDQATDLGPFDWMVWLGRSWDQIEATVQALLKTNASSQQSDTERQPGSENLLGAEPANQDPSDSDPGDEMGGTIEPFG